MRVSHEFIEICGTKLINSYYGIIIQLLKYYPANDYEENPDAVIF